MRRGAKRGIAAAALGIATARATRAQTEGAAGARDLLVVTNARHYRVRIC